MATVVEKIKTFANSGWWQALLVGTVIVATVGIVAHYSPDAAATIKAFANTNIVSSTTP